MDVGERLRLIRQMAGLSQRELAKRAGVTNSTVSMIEKNGVSPSVSSLKKVLAGIPMSIGDFFTLDLEPSEQSVFTAEQMPDIGSREVMLKLVGAPLKNRAMDILHEVYPPGADTGEEMLNHAGEEGGVVVSGQIELTVGLQVSILSAGDSYYFKSNHPHRFRNIFDQPCVIVSAQTPPT
ncbi:cupin domain-containing protein [Balneatrix alpica]|uniref:Cupin domain-containing protein n=2 Tax=Balneatrix alpica TaxID=75684 RepID=A0ABV5ZC82_9GAMM|nr:cupin domain-containing protein [Balneatrix alpica]